MKFFIKIYIIGFLSLNFLYGQEGYRIEMVMDTIEKNTPGMREVPKEIRFISPVNKIIKTIKAKPIKVKWEKKGWLFYSDLPVKISGNKKYCLEVTKVRREKSGMVLMERVLWNAKGERKWKKFWRVLPHEWEGDPSWDEGICHDGSIIYVSYKDSLKEYWLAVYDTLGNEIVKIKNFRGFFDIRISPDGKLIGARVDLPEEERKGYTGMYFLFLDTQRGRTKIVKGEGEINGERWRGDFAFWEGSKIRVYWIPLSPKYAEIPGGGEKMRIVSFNELPEDILILFGGEK